MWYEVTAYCDEGPFRLITDNRDEALDWAAFQEKKHGCRPSDIREVVEDGEISQKDVEKR